MTAIELTLNEARAVLDAVFSREDFIQEQLRPGAPWDTGHFRSPELQSAIDKIADTLDTD